MKTGINAIVALNACAWPFVFAAYAILSKDYYRIFFYVAAGAMFGGIVFLVLATLVVVLAYCFPDRPLARNILAAAPAARKLIVCGAIMIAIGVAGFIIEFFTYKPPFGKL